ncbi:DUF3570 domain-containing protein [Massilia dura]|uniref:DUF3570 domain-containing protein n=1 Tax=Pseudoduganella dura TaxID=321982 RepID=A0A6I3XJQ6_9BURK|nr:DUF3570 domain-containing protein [Pseudoduganella dura]MUI15756.1 DUF3570 domain-containing protein [Pseudoduganella dura]GGX89134.1 hypothetical protein GCM10007386_19940 [Pseudoduganella dura]
MTIPIQPDGDTDAFALPASLLAAALLLPGVEACAQTPPEHGSISLRYLDYADRQPGLDRIRVHSPSIAVVAPIAGEWSLEGTLTADDVSGATPRYHTAVSGASRMADDRKAGGASVTRYFRRGTLTASAAYSTEHDYVSRALSVNGTVSSEDNNTTWAFGLAGSRDRIDPVNHIVENERRRTVSVLAGVTRVLTPNDIGQVTLTRTNGSGYYDDPYKLFDNRPRSRWQNTVLLRWNHHLDGTGGTSRLGYRYYSDSYGIRAHTLSGEYVHPVGEGWSVVPELRLYTQRAARFYYDPVYDSALGEPFPPGFAGGGGRFSSADQRLSGFGAVTVGIKVAGRINRWWTVDFKVEAYEQRGSWRLFGDGSPGLAPLRARMFQFGVTRQW